MTLTSWDLPSGRTRRATVFCKILQGPLKLKRAESAPDPQDGRAEVSCPDFKRAESAESALSSASWKKCVREHGTLGHWPPQVFTYIIQFEQEDHSSPLEGRARGLRSPAGDGDDRRTPKSDAGRGLRSP